MYSVGSLATHLRFRWIRIMVVLTRLIGMEPNISPYVTLQINKSVTIDKYLNYLNAKYLHIRVFRTCAFCASCPLFVFWSGTGRLRLWVALTGGSFAERFWPAAPPKAAEVITQGKRNISRR